MRLKLQRVPLGYYHLVDHAPADEGFSESRGLHGASKTRCFLLFSQNSTEIRKVDCHSVSFLLFAICWQFWLATGQQKGGKMLFLKRTFDRVRFGLDFPVSFTEGQERFKQGEFNSNLTRDWASRLAFWLAKGL